MDVDRETRLNHGHQASFYMLGIVCGILIHRGVFVHGEWHVQTPHIVLTHICMVSLQPLLPSPFPPVFWGYSTGIVLSILVYRVFFHRLTKAGFPGPWWAPISKIWHVWLARKSQNHLVLDALHDKYGDIVRTGPAEVTVFTPDAFMTVDGPRSQCIKSEFYDLLQGIGYPSLVNTRDGPTHAARRREWRPGFSKDAVQRYESRVSPHMELLIGLLRDDAAQGRPSNVRDYLYWFGFDAMGEFVFGKSFGMLGNRRPALIVARLKRALSLLGPLTPTPWILHLGLRLAPRVGVIKDWFDSLDWCRTQMWNRLHADEPRGPTARDLAYYLMEDGGNRTVDAGNGRNWNLSWLTGDSLLAVVAGSDPTTVTLIGVFAELAKHSEHADKIFEEVGHVDATDSGALSGLPHLNGVIKEAMRLYPAVLSGGSRKTMDQSVMIGGSLIPPHTTIVLPRFTINRREDCFERPLEFIPERWTSRPDMVRNRAGYTPFGTGSRSCLGRFLAEDMMRGVITRVVKRFRFKLAPGETGNRVLDEMRDQFVPNPGPLSLCFEERSSCV
ncbi:hypothetical protein G6O67_002864 [Ophiocordyceps sinensis]|uniref:Cytochrome P450 n=1 Tax=Ophiocordyceps sinensis TaxID=72228 RepID=A0A8H4V7X9_9HYPO|nr:hypothetical protein G6O67_002864 [Ophiocordyceps sinensis]